MFAGSGLSIYDQITPLLAAGRLAQFKCLFQHSYLHNMWEMSLNISDFSYLIIEYLNSNSCVVGKRRLWYFLFFLFSFFQRIRSLNLFERIWKDLSGPHISVPLYSAWLIKNVSFFWFCCFCFIWMNIIYASWNVIVLQFRVQSVDVCCFRVSFLRGP